MLHSFEALFPGTDLLLDGLPFCEFDFAEHMTLDDDYFVELVNLCIDDLVLDCFDSPQFNIFNVNLNKQNKVINNGLR